MMLLDTLLTTALLLPLLLPQTIAEDDKRQVGVLARAGELPKGKRSVSALARNGELPGKRGTADDLRLMHVSKWLSDMEAALRLEELLDREVSKRNMEAMARSGYLVKPATEPPEIRQGFFDADDFLGKELDDASTIEKRETGGAGLEQNQVGSSRRKRSPEFVNELPADLQDYGDYLDELFGNSLQKRFLGRIPQIGRAAQKIQPPPGRRRPQLRPNWL